MPEYTLRSVPMKKSFGLMVALLLVLSLTAFAEPDIKQDPYAFQVNTVELVGEGGWRDLRIEMKNHGARPIRGYVVEVSLLNEDGTPFLSNPADKTGSFQELRLSSYAELLGFNPALKPGALGEMKEPLLSALNAAAGARAAITYYMYQDGEEVYLGEDALAWVFSDGTQLEPADPTQFRGSMDPAVLERARTAPLGMMVENRPMYGYLADSYGFNHGGGSWVGEVSEGSRAHKAGVQMYDMVVSIGSIRYLEDPLAYDEAKVRLAEGEEVELVVERDGELLTLVLKPD